MFYRDIIVYLLFLRISLFAPLGAVTTASFVTADVRHEEGFYPSRY